ncbi:MAG: hypothetical protein M3083_18235 [Actinomycetota bacterium]|nr:hypothetical protein [Actinomycetota bacterium]MDQ6946315.1 hypothetical protein [Actinomycetota bacterium]
MVAAIFAIACLTLLPVVTLWMWRLQHRVIASLVPGAKFSDIAALADLPVTRTMESTPPVVTGPAVQLLGVTREASWVLLAYRALTDVPAPGGAVRTVLLLLEDRGDHEMAVLEGWRTSGTPLVLADVAAGEVAIQHPLTRLTLTLPLVA